VRLGWPSPHHLLKQVRERATDDCDRIPAPLGHDRFAGRDMVPKLRLSELVDLSLVAGPGLDTRAQLVDLGTPGVGIRARGSDHQYIDIACDAAISTGHGAEYRDRRRRW